MQGFSIRNLNYFYKDEFVLKNINLLYENKDFLAIIGPNGGGKTTLVKLILALLDTKQNIELKGITREQISYVPQIFSSNENFSMRVLEVVLMGLVHNKKIGFYTKQDKKKALEILEKLSIKELWDKNIAKLSGGEKQRVFIARALVSNCKLLILDEPTASVDTKTSIQIFDLLSNLHKNGVGIVVICHDINIVLAYADKIAYLNKELFLHDNDKEKSKLIKHLYENHQHFCDVEMSLNDCICESKVY